MQEELWHQSIFLVEPSSLVQESCSQFHQHFMSSFCANFLTNKFQKPNCKHIKASKILSYKKCSYIVSEIDTRCRNHIDILQLYLCVLDYLPNQPKQKSYCQFHQHFMSSFSTDIILPKNYKPKL